MDTDRKRLYNASNVGSFIFVEDEFQFNETEDESKAHVLIDFARMNEMDRRLLLDSIPNETPGLSELQNYAKADSWIFETDWTNAPLDDVEPILKDRPEIMKLYQAVPNTLWEGANQQIFLRYGIGVVIQDIFKPLFQEVIRSSPRYLSTRIYKTYVEEIRLLIMQDLEKCKNSEKNAVLVLDNIVGDTRLAAQMIHDLKFRDPKTCCPIYATVFSTANKVSSDESCETSNLYIGYANKSEKIEGVDRNIARAAINSLIQQYKLQFKTVIDKNCDTLAKNPDLVEYLYGMARAEGEPGYELLQQWISFMTNHDMEQSNEMLQLMKLSGSLDSYKAKTNWNLNVPKELVDAAHSENFLSTVNKFCTATAPGDIFEYNDMLYVLVGQDCDYMMGDKRTRNAPLCEFVSAELVAQGDIEKLNNDEKYVYINNYKDSSGNTYVLKINYGTRMVICNEIINLCSFNQMGFCKIDCDTELSEDVSTLLQPYMLEYYEKLRNYFRQVKIIKKEFPKFYQTANDLKIAKPLIDISNYSEQGNILDFGIKRISRLKKTASLYLYKMFLEYRGRMPYTTINLTGYSIVTVTIKYSEKSHPITMYIKLTSDRNKNLKDRDKLTWYIHCSDLQEAINVLIGEHISLKRDSDYIELHGKKSTELNCGSSSIILQKKVQNNMYSLNILMERLSET